MPTQSPLCSLMVSALISYSVITSLNPICVYITNQYHHHRTLDQYQEFT